MEIFKRGVTLDMYLALTGIGGSIFGTLLGPVALWHFCAFYTMYIICLKIWSEFVVRPPY